ncbi:hypothetical protein GO613_00710 [Azoarcus communis]|uniref:Uncharacterized protein n=2 Tax=root TaxID=1 RepID=A0A323UY42_9RHOO|nr:hypothetical protein [Parazoarcus communis]NMG46631.1 hypothetical protein [Parazoarcus communis]NMG68965.1 hypothetical protein [Parazoarcus communis SWub3 = DSM 12120]PZA16833.1 hypothetical protein DNK49_09260 [Azoarcus communis] [Parazoarcus communis SWub3 = DSM 12120]
MTSPSPAQTAQDQPDRRQYHRVREIFEEAYVMIEPFFAKENRWANVSLDHLAYRVVRDHYPELSAIEVHVLVMAAHRVYVDDTR